MERFSASIIAACTLLAVGIAAKPSDPTSQDAGIKKVEGTGDNVWVFGGLESNKAKVGDPSGRELVIRAKSGDVVQFVVTGGQHGVIFENGKSQIDSGVFEVVPAAGELELKDPSDQTMDPLFLPAYYERDDAKLTLKRGSGPIVTIKIKDLKPGPDNGILFGCNPHSRPAANNNVMMLGVIVLDEAEKVDGDATYKRK